MAESCPLVDRPLYTVRPAERTDVAHMAAIEREAFSDPWSESAFTDVLRMAAAHVTVAANADNHVVAYCILLTAADQGEIANLAVTASARRQGLANRLLEEALSFARARHVVAVFLEVRESNVSARALYRSKNFAEIGRRRGYYQRPPEDALVLQWTGATGKEAVL